MTLSVADAKRGSQAEWLRAIVEAMDDAVVVTDAKGRVVLANAALERLLARRGVVERRAKDVIDDEPLRRALRSARKLGRSSEVEVRRSRGGLSRTYRATVSPLPNRSGAVAVLHDVTSLEEVDRMRRDFVGNASHEIRTPLTAIRGMAETLRDGVADPEAARRFFDAILRQTARLERLAQDLVSLARAESDEPLALAALDVREVCREVAQSFATAAKAKRVAIQLDLPARPARAKTNEHALHQVLANLVDNALKYAPPKKPVVIRVRVVGARVVIEVRDAGPGIAREHHERIFERFYRIDEGRSREMGGTGLGLSIVRHLVARLQGTIAVESAPGEGSTFRIVLRRPPRRA